MLLHSSQRVLILQADAAAQGVCDRGGLSAGNRPASPDAVDHGGCAIRAHADDANLRVDRFGCQCDASQEAAAAEGNHDSAHCWILLEQLEADGALAGDDPQIVERLDDQQPLAAGEGGRDVCGIVLRVSLHHQVDAGLTEQVDLRLRHALGDAHRHRDAEPLAHGRDRTTVVAGRVRHDSGHRGVFFAHREQRVCGASHLEAARGLQALELEHDLGARLLAEPIGAHEGSVCDEALDPLLCLPEICECGEAHASDAIDRDESASMAVST
ncbi:hypothetical protein CZ674_13495 [Agrococcus casei LMG 22410]|uniref:Uncharacterized protein n=1 Tax=Agrococcus casei LMG 22410 TaxID=1255656 RepID=A0A1R4GNZ0_9MICO|nr:hypothetical protein CZ674_13495 [Agrococcus casei LMG 22410]